MTEKYTFDDDKKKKSGNFLWNGATREFLGRDGAAWFKLTFFYAIFYLLLGSFFIGMLAIFVAIMPEHRPTYVGEDSTIASRGLNPGVGFRPQVDVEDATIFYNKNVFESKTGYGQFARSLDLFLKEKYDDKTAGSECTSGATQENENTVCNFDYKEIFGKTPCNAEQYFGYQSYKPCVMIKLNKIITWVPSNSSISIKCEGETSVDKDNIKEITYFSEGDAAGNTQSGSLDAKYFPYSAQKNYRAPFVFVRPEVTKNTVVNVLCKAYDGNIQNTDRINKRGMTKFTLYVEATGEENESA